MVMTVKVDGYTRFILTAITVLLTVVAVGLWYEAPSTVSTAEAGIPDSGAQLGQIVDKMDQINKSIGELQVFLASGKIKVQVVEPDKKIPPKAPIAPVKPVK
jgi:hypothetical protein